MATAASELHPVSLYDDEEGGNESRFETKEEGEQALGDGRREEVDDESWKRIRCSIYALFGIFCLSIPICIVAYVSSVLVSNWKSLYITSGISIFVAVSSAVATAMRWKKQTCCTKIIGLFPIAVWIVIGVLEIPDFVRNRQQRLAKSCSPVDVCAKVDECARVGELLFPPNCEPEDVFPDQPCVINGNSAYWENSTWIDHSCDYVEICRDVVW